MEKVWVPSGDPLCWCCVERDKIDMLHTFCMASLKLSLYILCYKTVFLQLMNQYFLMFNKVDLPQILASKRPVSILIREIRVFSGTEIAALGETLTRTICTTDAETILPPL